MLYWFRYAMTLQDILSSETGKAAAGMMGLSSYELGKRIEVGIRKDPECREISTRLSPVEAAIVSVSRGGMSLQKLGSTEGSRLGGHALQLALIDYAQRQPRHAFLIGSLLKDWEEKLPSGSY